MSSPSIGTPSLELIECVSDSSGSAPLVIVPDLPLLDRSKTKLDSEVEGDIKSYVVFGAMPDMYHVEQYAKAFEEYLEAWSVKRATFVGLGRGGNIAQAVAIAFPKLVRRVILVNGTTRLAPDLWTRSIDALERFLPLGLPLRSPSKAFDSRPYLHRLRSPSLIVTTSTASLFEKHQAEILMQTIPNAWHAEVTGDAWTESEILTKPLRTLITNFLDVPTKRPQKNLAA